MLEPGWLQSQAHPCAVAPAAHRSEEHLQSSIGLKPTLVSLHLHQVIRASTALPAVAHLRLYLHRRDMRSTPHWRC
jgi:hypothetical protein